MKLYMQQKVFTWRDKFTVKDETGADCYYVEGELISLGKKLHIYDKNHSEAALVRQKFITLLPRYYVEMGGREVCQVAKKLTLFKPKYDLVGLGWQVSGDFWAHEYTLRDGDKTVMQVSKRWVSWGDSYELDIADASNATLCLAVVLAIDAAVEATQNAIDSSNATPSTK